MSRQYLYEPHLHTAEISGCASSSGAEFARHFAALGYQGIFITDHFLFQLIPGRTDAVEILSAARTDDENRHARDYAASFGLPGTAGTDIHATSWQRRCGVRCSRRLKDGRDYLAVLKSGDAVSFDSANDGLKKRSE